MSKKQTIADAIDGCAASGLLQDAGRDQVSDIDERDADGNLTDWALAFDALGDCGCDCGVDEPGSCLACLCEQAMRT
jgi:hypothetical protein